MIKKVKTGLIKDMPACDRPIFLFNISDVYTEPSKEEQEEILQQQFNDYYGYSGNSIYDTLRINNLNKLNGL